MDKNSDSSKTIGKIFDKSLFLDCVKLYLPLGKKSSVLIYLAAVRIMKKEEDYRAEMSIFNEAFLAIDFVDWISGKAYELNDTFSTYIKNKCLVEKDSEILRLLSLNL